MDNADQQPDQLQQKDLPPGGGRFASKYANVTVEWDTRKALDVVLRIHDALSTRKGQSIPLHPEEVANLLQLEEFISKAKRFALRRCLCNTVYCRSPEKDSPCVVDPEKAMADPDLILTCKWRGRHL
jgi:hypothetical protein